MKKTISLVLILALGLAAEVANADFTFGTPTNLGPTVNSSAMDINPRLTGNGLELFFMTVRTHGLPNCEIWFTRRATTGDPWGEPEPVDLPNASTGKYATPDITDDGLSLYLYTDRRPDERYGAGDIYVTTRATLDDPWTEPLNLGSVVNTSFSESCPWISANELTLWFSGDPWINASPQRQRPSGYGLSDIWVTTRATKEEQWSPPQNLGPVINSSSMDASPFVTDDGLVLFLHSDRPGGHGYVDLWMARRYSRDDEWGIPLNLGPTVNSASEDAAPEISPDGSVLFFTSNRSGGSGDMDLWQVSIEPVVDLNGDGIVDSDDICIMIDYWGTDEPLCDISPTPFGDGIVDVQDLIVLAEHLFEGIPPVEPEGVNVDEQDEGSEVELEQGQILVVTLESNPTTGYRWEQVENQESILEQMGEAEFKPSETGEPPLVGAGGWEIFRFKAISAGQMTLQLVYHRPWEEGVEPINTFSIEVVVN